MIPELIGRLPIIATLNQLSEEDLARILTESKDALTRQYEVLFRYDGARLRFGYWWYGVSSASRSQPETPPPAHGQAARLRRLQATTRPIEPPIPQRTSDDGSGTELIEVPTPTSRKNSRVMGPAAVENSRTLPNACDPV